MFSLTNNIVSVVFNQNHSKVMNSMGITTIRYYWNKVSNTLNAQVSYRIRFNLPGY
jgi:hypothetical protein